MRGGDGGPDPRERPRARARRARARGRAAVARRARAQGSRRAARRVRGRSGESQRDRRRGAAARVRRHRRVVPVRGPRRPSSSASPRVEGDRRGRAARRCSCPASRASARRASSPSCAASRTTAAPPCCGGAATRSSASPYEPFAEALRHYVGAVAPERLRAELGPLGGELTRIVPDLAARVPGLAEPLQGEPETERHRLFESVVDLLAEMSVAAAGGARARRRALGRQAVAPAAAAPAARRRADATASCIATYRDTDLDRIAPARRRARRSPPRARRRAPRPRTVSTSTRSRRSWRRPPATSSTTPALDLAQALVARDRGQPVLRRRGAAPPRGDRARSCSATGAGPPASTLGDIEHPRGHPRGRRPAPVPPLRRPRTRRSCSRAVIGPMFDVHDDRGRGRPVRRRAVRRARRGDAAPRSSARCPARSAATRSRTR